MQTAPLNAGSSAKVLNLVERSPGDQAGWVNVSVNWPRIQGVFSRAALKLREAPKNVLKAASVTAHAAVDTLDGWLQAIRTFLARLFGSLRQAVAAPRGEGAPGAKAPGAPAADADSQSKREPDLLNAQVPEAVADRFEAELNAFLEGAVPLEGVSASNLPTGLDDTSVGGLAMMQSHVALKHFKALSLMDANIEIELAKRMSEANFQPGNKDPFAALETLLKLQEKDPSHPLLKISDPGDVVVSLARRRKDVQALANAYLEAAAVDVHVASRKGVADEKIANTLSRVDMSILLLEGMLKSRGLVQAAEAVSKRADASFDIPKVQPKNGPIGVVSNVTTLPSAAVKRPAEAPAPAAHAPVEAKEGSAGELLSADSPALPASTSAPAPAAARAGGFGSLHQFQATQEDNEWLGGATEPDPDEFESMAPRG
jgi:hypothetical protein